MDFNKFTQKAQEALNTAQEIATKNQNQAITEFHLLQALLIQSDGIVPVLISKLDLSIDEFTTKVGDKIKTFPKVEGTVDTFASPEFRKVLDEAVSLAAKLRDDYVSTEHLFMAILNLQKDFLDISVDEVMEQLKKVRGSQKVSDPNPESKYQALEKYTQNFTQLAKEGKIDPVIGRDEEIRRIIYTTNTIESLNRQFRKVTKTTTIFPNDESLKKLLYLVQNDITKKWNKSIRHWGKIIAQFAIIFPERIKLS